MKSIIGIEKRVNPYTMIDNAVLNDRRLSFKARGVLAYLLSKPENWEIRMHDLVDASPDGMHAAQGALKELQALGYASLIPYKENGKLVGRRWIIHEVPLEMSDSRQGKNCLIGESPTRQFSDRRKIRSSENSIVGKVPQLVMNDINKKILLQNTDVAVSAREKTPPTPPIFEKNKNEIEGGCTADLQHETKKTPNPPVPAPPPAPAPVRTAWQESEAYKAGLEKFAEMLRAQPGMPSDIDCAHYYDRATIWANGKQTQPVSDNWVSFIAAWVRGDIRKNVAVLVSQVSTTGPVNRPTYRSSSTGNPHGPNKAINDGTPPELMKRKQLF